MIKRRLHHVYTHEQTERERNPFISSQNEIRELRNVKCGAGRLWAASTKSLELIKDDVK